MNTRVLGRGAAAMKTSAQGFGCMGMTAFYGKPMSNVAAEELLVNAFKNGITHWDTAEVYQGKNDDGSVLYNESQVAFGIKAVNNRDALKSFLSPFAVAIVFPSFATSSLKILLDNGE